MHSKQTDHRHPADPPTPCGACCGVRSEINLSVIRCGRHHLRRQESIQRFRLRLGGPKPASPPAVFDGSVAVYCNVALKLNQLAIVRSPTFERHPGESREPSFSSSRRKPGSSAFIPSSI